MTFQQKLHDQTRDGCVRGMRVRREGDEGETCLSAPRWFKQAKKVQVMHEQNRALLA